MLRRREYAPKLTDAEVIAMELVGEFLSLDTDKGIWRYFKHHWSNWFPNLGSRANFAKQSSHLWFVKQLILGRITNRLGTVMEAIHLVDGFPMPVCHFARAVHCTLFKGSAQYGHCATKKQTYYGFQGQVLVGASGAIMDFTLTAAARLRPNEFKKHAFWFAKVGAYQEARQQLERLNSVKNQELALYVYILMKLVNYEQAIVYLKKALPQDTAPQNYLQWFYVGVLVNHRAYEEANTVLQAITPKDEGLAFSATMFIKAQKTEDVLRIINQVIRKLMDSAAVKNLAKAEHFTPEMLFLRNLQGETELDITWLLDT
jgi:tetratricopeptide (TPR) repeat protein